MNDESNHVQHHPVYPLKGTNFLKLLLLIVYSFSLHILYSQSPPKDPDPQVYFTLADSLFKLGSYPEAAKQYQKAVDQFASLGMPDYEAKALNKLAEMQWRMGRLEVAQENSNLALSFYKNHDVIDSLQILNHAMSYNNLGVINGMKGDFQTALQAFKNVIDIGEKNKNNAKTLLGIAHHNIGRIYGAFGKSDSALYHYTQSLKFKDLASPEDQLKIADTYYTIGLIYSQRGRNDEGLSYTKKAFDIQKRVLGPDHPQIAFTYNVLGAIYTEIGQYNLALEYTKESLRITEGKEGLELNTSFFYSSMSHILIFQGAYDEALAYQNKCLELRKMLLDSNHTDIAATYHDFARIYFGKGEIKKAEEYELKSLRIREVALHEGNPEVINSYRFLANLYHKMGKHTKAYLYIGKAIDKLERNVKGKFPLLGDLYNVKGTFDMDNASYAHAIESFQAAIENNYEPSFDETSSSGAITEDTGILLYSLSSKAHAHYLMFLKTKNIGDLKKSLKIYTDCDNLIRLMRKAYLRYEDKIAFGKNSNEIYHQAVNVCLTLSNLLDDKSYQREAFYLAEKARTTALSDHVQDLTAKQFAGIPDNLLNLEKTLKVDLSYYQSEMNKLESLSGEFDESKMNYAANKAFEVKLKLDSLSDYLEENHQTYFDLKYDQRVIQIEDIQRKLKRNEAVLEYLDQDSLLYVFSLTASTFDVQKLQKDPSFDASISNVAYFFNEYEDLLQSAEAFEKEASILYETLLQDVLLKLAPEVNKLIIIPTPELSLLPWGILVADESSPENPGSTYLIEDYSIGYGYSSSLYFKERKKESKRSRAHTILAFAPAYPSPLDEATIEVKEVFRDSFTPLKWNQMEALAIEKFFNGTRIFKANEATESRFKAEASNYQILHLASHAFVDHEEAMRSKLIFSPDSDTIEDGSLHTYELYNMQLDAELAILSACQTGFGQLEESEGIVSLARGFAYAGVPSVVMSHWKVDDKATSMLMEKFYKYLSEGLNKSLALQKAKLEYIEEASPYKQHPFFWGAFVIIGDDSPISTASNQWIWIILFAGVLLLVFIGLSLRNRKRV